MKKIAFTAIILLAFAGIAFADTGGQRFSVADAKERAENASLVILTGHVIEDMGNRKFMFEDATGRIRLDVGFMDGGINRQLRALRPTDLVEIFGDIHDERGPNNPIHVHVKRVTSK